MVKSESIKAQINSRWLSILTFLSFLLVCALNIWAFEAFLDRNYIEWYSASGPLIAMATAAFGAAWGDLDKNTALVSVNPRVYLGACLHVAGLPLFAAGSHMRSRNQRTSIAFETIPLLILAPFLVAAILAWLLLVVPVQYFLFLVAGSLPRLSLSTSVRVSARITNGTVQLFESTDEGLNRPEDGWWDASMRDKLVTLANAYGAALLFLLNMLWQ